MRSILSGVVISLFLFSQCSNSNLPKEGEPQTGDEAGAVLKSSDGKFKVVIPPGAMNETVDFHITQVEDPADLPRGYFRTTGSYNIEPAYVFQKEVRVELTLDTDEIALLNLDKPGSQGFVDSRSSTEADAGRFSGWMNKDSQVAGDKIIFETRHFSTFGGGTPPPGNQAPNIMGAFYYFKPGLSFMPHRVRARVIEPDGDTMSVNFLVGPAGGPMNLIPMTQQGSTNWYQADIPYEAMSQSGILMQISATDQFGANTTLPSAPFLYPDSSNVPAFINNYDVDQDGDGILDAWEADNGYNPNDPGDTAGVTDTDGDGIPDVDDTTPNGEANPAIDSLVITPDEVAMGIGETVSFAVTASLGGVPRFVDASIVTTGTATNGQPVGTLNGSAFTADLPGLAGVVASASGLNATASVTVADSLAPNDITDLTATAISSNTIRLQFTAPGNDAGSGQAAVYEIRYATTAIADDAACSAAVGLSHNLVPKTAGASETLDINIFAPASTYHFCVRAYDYNSNRSVWNGSASATTLSLDDLVAPASITDAVASVAGADSIRLDWTAVGDDGVSGAATTYQIRKSTGIIQNDSECLSAVQVANITGGLAAGTAMDYTVGSLSDSTVYFFCVLAFDDANNRSPWTSILMISTPQENLAPTVVLPADFTATSGPGSPVTLDGTASTDPDVVVCGANPASYTITWNVVQKPPTSTVTDAGITNGNTLSAEFTPDVVGDYTFRLTFIDDPGSCFGSAKVDLALVVITVSDTPQITIDNVVDGGLVETGFIVGTAPTLPAGGEVQVSIDSGPFVAALGTNSWVFQLPTGANTWRKNSVHTLDFRTYDGVSAYSGVMTLNLRKGRNKDINGDGYIDLIVSSTLINGALYFYYGGPSGITATGPGDADATVTGASYFGNSSNSTGDYNGDGYADVVTSAPHVGTYLGKAYIINGDAGGVASGDIEGSAIADTVITGATTQSFLGWAVALGDANGDGYDDFAMGERVNGSDGRVYIINGAAGGIPSGTMGSGVTADSIITGEAGAADNFAHYKIEFGDVNGDGYEDIGIGAQSYSNYKGRLTIFHGSAAGLPTGQIGVASFQPDTAIVGRQDWRLLGGGGLRFGDIDNDGMEDIVFGSTGNNMNAAPGEVYLFYGQAAGIPSGQVTVDLTPDEAFYGIAPEDYFGASVALGDINGDGNIDLVIGQTTGSSGSPGNVYIHHNNGTTIPGGTIGVAGFDATHTITSIGTGGNFFGNPVDLGDVNGDGFWDLGVTDSYYDNGADSRAYIFYSTGAAGITVTQDVGADVILSGGASSGFGRLRF